MNQTEKIKTAFERQTKVVTLREGMGIGTAVTKVKVKEGLTCEIIEGDWKLIADMSEKWGGNNLGPNPGVFGRGALGSCIAIGYMRWAAKLGVQIDELEVQVCADYDTRGELGVSDKNPGYSKVKYLVNISSPSSQEEIIKMMNTADEHSSYIDHFIRPVELRREVNIKNEVQL
jgi:uncharacterized OsmC-like protein